MIRTLTIIAFFLIIEIVTPPIPVRAGAEFSTDYDVIYNINEAGETEVRQNITLTNNTAGYYAADFTLIVASKNIKGVTASDSRGAVKTEIKVTDNQTKIRVIFGYKSVGRGSRYNFNLKYLITDTAGRHGRIWEVIVPKLANADEIGDYNLKINVPLSFGPELYLSPKTAAGQESDRRVYYYNKESFRKTGIILAFGTAQNFDFKLTYHLSNPNIFSSKTKIAFPPDILGVQQIIYRQIKPAPIQVEADTDGNYLATYRLAGSETATVTLEGKAVIYHPSRDLGKSGLIKDIPSNLVNLYTKPDKYWEVTDPEIKALAARIYNPDQTAAGVAEEIFNYVTANLTYSPSRISSELSRFGAKNSLKNRNQAVCMEFTDLLVTLLRAAGLPARGLEGYAYTDNPDSRPAPEDALHTWAEIYLPNIGWISVDPTWAATTNGLDYFSKLDTNHIVFAVKGISSEYPFPAGTYKVGPDQKKDIQISFSDNRELKPGENLVFNVSLPAKINGGLPVAGRIRLINEGSAAVFGLNGEVEITGLSPPYRKKINFGTIPPLGSKEMEINFREESFLKIGEAALTVRLNYLTFAGTVKNVNHEKAFKITPVFIEPDLNPLTMALGLGLLSILFFLLSLRGIPQKLLDRLLDRLPARGR